MRYLAERDGPNCALCGTEVDMDLKSGPTGDPSGLGPSIDHIFPRSLRPDLADEPSNFRLTHWACNFERKNTLTGDEQLILASQEGARQ